MSVLGAKLTGRAVKFCWDREEEMQVGAPRGAEHWHIKDGVARDGRILARQFTGLFDSGAYTRLSSYAVVKCTGHIPGPYTIPNVSSNVYCVFTNRTPATAMRGFGITGVDFSIECQMDRVAEAVGLDPIELRILNAYRDGDIKAHRRNAKNCALIECCQVAAEKANWPISNDARTASSLHGGGEGWRAEIPETVTDQAGKIGERRRDPSLTLEPASGAAATGRIAAGTRGKDIEAYGPQDQDMEIDLARTGYLGTPSGRTPVPGVSHQPISQPASGITNGAAESRPAIPAQTAAPGQISRPASAPAPLSAPPVAPASVPGAQPQQPPPVSAPTAPAATGSQPNTAAQSNNDAQPGTAQPKRKPRSRFLSGTRRR